MTIPTSPQPKAPELREQDVDESHVQLGTVVAVVKRFTGVERLQAWWSIAYLADPAEAGWLTLGEWRAIAAIARRQGDNLEASPCAPPGWRPA